MKKIKLIEGAEIITLENKNPLDHRGAVFEWTNITKEKIIGITTFYRKKGTVSGNHFHKGTDPSKKPELLFFVKGKAKLYAYNKFTNEEVNKIIEAGTILIFYPNIFHKLTIIEDSIQLEPRISIFNPKNPDCYSEQDYKNL